MANVIRDPRHMVVVMPGSGHCVKCEKYVTHRYKHTDYPHMLICMGCVSDFGGIPGGKDWSKRVAYDHESWDGLAAELGYDVVQRR